MIIDSKKYNGICSCGKEHKMTTVLSVIERGCLKDIDSYLRKFKLEGYKVAVYDENTYLATADRHPDVDYEIILNPENLHANEKGVEMLLSELPKETKVLIAVGSGTIHDLTRYCAFQKNIEFVSCPTAASVDGFCSSVAAMTWNGCKKTMTAKAPLFVLADIDVIMKAPIKLTKSGFGDMVGKYIALTDWKIAYILQDEFYCNEIADLMTDATQKAFDSVGGIAAGDENAYVNITLGLILSGLAMQMMGNSRPASGAEHHISHIIEMKPPFIKNQSDALHGEKVGVGTILALETYKQLAERKISRFDDYKTFSKEKIIDIFGEKMSTEIISENENDCVMGLRGETIKKNWTRICEVIQKLPNPKTLKEVCIKNGIKNSLEDIGVSDSLKDSLLMYSPAVRNRLTLMRIKNCIDGYSEVK